VLAKTILENVVEKKCTDWDWPTLNSKATFRMESKDIEERALFCEIRIAP
jgi:hypothetical protein